MFFCSVILLCYNSTLEQLMFSLESIIKQKNIKIEIIIADDCSVQFYENEILYYFKTLNTFISFNIIKQERNVGTVKNLYSALKLCKGDFVKIIGAGDLLFDENVLFKMCSVLKSRKTTMAFGLAKQFYLSEGKIQINKWVMPKNIKAYINEDNKQIFNTIIKQEQWIAGVLAIYNTKKVIPLIEKILDKVLYCEDMITAFLVLEGENIVYIPINSMWYEAGEGLASKKSNLVSRRIRNDQIQMFKMIQFAEKNIWRVNGKKIIHTIGSKVLRRILKIIFQPGLLFIEYKTKKQDKHGAYSIPGNGFLDDISYIEHVYFICENLRGKKNERD